MWWRNYCTSIYMVYSTGATLRYSIVIFYAVHQILFMLYTKYCLCCTANIVYAVHKIFFMLYTKYCLCCTQNIFYAVHQIFFMLYTKYIFLLYTKYIFYAVHQIFLCCTLNIYCSLQESLTWSTWEIFFVQLNSCLKPTFD